MDRYKLALSKHLKKESIIPRSYMPISPPIEHTTNHIYSITFCSSICGLHIQFNCHSPPI